MNTNFSNQPQRLIGPIAVIAVLLAVFAIYAPGRYGTFLLDDFINLGALAQVESLSNIDGLLRYLFSNDVGVANRWLSKLSFLINDTSWPSHAFSFKHTNILIHMLNGLLVIWMILHLLRLTGHDEFKSQLIAIITGSLWMLHPLNVSTTLYVVQRMTELATMFTLIGVLLYLKGREMLPDNRVRGYTWMTTALIGCSILGFLCKESGALLPIYVLVVEIFLLRDVTPVRPSIYWRSLFLATPIALLALWQIYMLPRWLNLYDLYHSFNIVERLLTQARALIDYLISILIPVRSGTGVFHDDYAISQNLLSPPSTVISLIVLLSLVGVALAYRKKLPILCFGVFWFFGGHVLESGAIPLELYFEHRNYLPMVGVLFIVCYYAITVETKLRSFLYISLLALVALSAVSTWQNVRIWSSPTANVVVWENEHPDSARVLEYASNYYVGSGSFVESQKRLEKLKTLKPEWAGPKLKLLLLSCITGNNNLGIKVDELIMQMRSVEWDPVSVTIIKNLFNGMQKKPCHMLNIDHILAMVDALISNPSYRLRKPAMASLFLLNSRVNGYLGNEYTQAKNLQKSFSWKRNWHVAIEESQVWASLGEYSLALEAVSRARESYKVKLHTIHFYFDSDELSGWEQTLRKLNAG